ncbi:MAG: acyl carrier protein [Candidatus Omnitrophica bacterium]|nr:acyl carrier protein [Candidatus Omnitrophota bacterium]
MANNIEQEIREIIAEIIEKKPEEITPDANLVEDLGADSMMALEILAAIEKKYRVVVPEENLSKLTSLRTIMELVKNLKKK